VKRNSMLIRELHECLEWLADFGCASETLSSRTSANAISLAASRNSCPDRV
jgi:hypothetical protein